MVNRPTHFADEFLDLIQNLVEEEAEREREVRGKGKKEGKKGELTMDLPWDPAASGELAIRQFSAMRGLMALISALSMPLLTAVWISKGSMSDENEKRE